MKYVAFISHSNKDGNALHAVRNHLEACGFSCFASERDLKHNANWQSQLVEAMDESEMLVYLHSKDANRSVEVSREINYFADKCHRPILVYRLDDVPYHKDRAYYLQSINYIDSLARPEEGLDQLAENVRNTLNGIQAEGRKDPSGKSMRRLRKTLVPILAAILLAFAFLGFHSYEKGKMKDLLAESAGLLARTDDWLAREDSLEFVLPAIDEAEERVRQCDRLLTVSVPESPDFDGLREQARQTLSDIRNRRIDTVKALYEPLKYTSKESRTASMGAILANIGRIHQLDSLLDGPVNEDIAIIENNLTTSKP